MLIDAVSLEEEVSGREDGSINLFEREMLSDFRKYLSSAIFHNVGPITAKRIVSHFGIRTAQVIETALHDLLQVKGVGRKRMLAIQKGWSFQRRIVEKSAELIRLKSVKQGCDGSAMAQADFSLMSGSFQTIFRQQSRT